MGLNIFMQKIGYKLYYQINSCNQSLIRQRVLEQWRTLERAKGCASPPIIFTEALVLKSGSTRKFSFQEVEPLLII